MEAKATKGTALISENLHLRYHKWAHDLDTWLHLTEMLAIIEAARDLMLRCDGSEGVRAGGSNIETETLHHALDAYDSKVDVWGA